MHRRTAWSLHARGWIRGGMKTDHWFCIPEIAGKKPCDGTGHVGISIFNSQVDGFAPSLVSGTGERVGICAQNGRNSPTIGHGGQEVSWSCRSGWRGLLIALGEFGHPPHFCGRCWCLGGDFRFKFVKGRVDELCFCVVPRSWTHQDVVQELQIVSVTLKCSDGMGSVVSGHKEYWAWCSGGLIKGQDSSEIIVWLSHQPGFGNLLRPRKEWSVTAASFLPATPALTIRLDQMYQVQTLLAPERGCRHSSQLMQCQILASRVWKNWASAPGNWSPGPAPWLASSWAARWAPAWGWEKNSLLPTTNSSPQLSSEGCPERRQQILELRQVVEVCSHLWRVCLVLGRN